MILDRGTSPVMGPTGLVARRDNIRGAVQKQKEKAKRIAGFTVPLRGLARSVDAWFDGSVHCAQAHPQDRKLLRRQV
jgi:hypothetical protein